MSPPSATRISVSRQGVEGERGVDVRPQPARQGLDRRRADRPGPQRVAELARPERRLAALGEPGSKRRRERRRRVPAGDRVTFAGLSPDRRPDGCPGQSGPAAEELGAGHRPPAGRQDSAPAGGAPAVVASARPEPSRTSVPGRASDARAPPTPRARPPGRRRSRRSSPASRGRPAPGARARPPAGRDRAGHRRAGAAGSASLLPPAAAWASRTPASHGPIDRSSEARGATGQRGLEPGRRLAAGERESRLRR